jgi:methyl-accepting chemotaxis protein
LNDPFLRAWLRFGQHELATLVPTVAIWAWFFGLADVTTMLVLWALRVAFTAALWHRALRPFAAQDWAELDDERLLALDARLLVRQQRFAARHVSGMLTSVLLGTLLALLPWAHVEFGLADVIGGLATLPVLMVLGTMQQSWMWEPLDARRAELGRLLAARGLLGRRKTDAALRRHFRRSALLVLSTFACGLGIALVSTVHGHREVALVQLRLHVAGALASDELPAAASRELVAGDDVPATLRAELEQGHEIVLALDHTWATTHASAITREGEQWVRTRMVVDERLGFYVVLLVVSVASLAIPVIGTTTTAASTLAKQLDQLRNTLHELRATGRLRELPRVVPLRNDEVDWLFIELNGILDMLDRVAAAASEIARGNLRVRLDDPGDVHDAFRAMTAGLRGMVLQIHTCALDLANAAAEIHSITQEQESAVKQQSQRMQEVSESVAALAGAADTISRAAQHVLDDANQAMTTTNGTIARIVELGRQAERIADLLDRIGEVADRSDLLALNGSLEATRAGEAGRGFALVAAEMRRLAERVTATVADVHAGVSAIEQAGNNSIAAAEDSRRLTEQTAAAAREITTITKRQSRETELAALHVRELTAVVIASAGSTSQTRSAAEGLRSQAELLERLTRQFELEDGERA